MSNPSVSQPPLSSEQRSAVFSRYNRLRHTAEAGRANRALGLVQRGEERPYHTTARACTCPDFVYRLAGTGQKCKHQLQMELSAAAEASAPAKPDIEEGSSEELLSNINSDLFD